MWVSTQFGNERDAVFLRGQKHGCNEKNYPNKKNTSSFWRVWYFWYVFREDIISRAQKRMLTPTQPFWKQANDEACVKSISFLHKKDIAGKKYSRRLNFSNEHPHASAENNETEKRDHPQKNMWHKISFHLQNNAKQNHQLTESFCYGIRLVNHSNPAIIFRNHNGI